MNAKEININRRYLYHAIRDLRNNENDSYYYLSDLLLAHPITDRNTIVLRDNNKFPGIITIEIKDTLTLFTFEGENQQAFTQVMSIYTQEIPEEYAQYVDDLHLVKEDLLNSPDQKLSLRKSSMPTISSADGFVNGPKPVFYSAEVSDDYSPSSDPLLITAAGSSPDKKLSSQLRKSGLFTTRQNRLSPESPEISMQKPVKSRSLPEKEKDTGLAHQDTSTPSTQSPQRLFSMPSRSNSEVGDSSQGLKLLRAKPRKLSFLSSESQMPNQTTQKSDDEYHIENIVSQYKHFGENPLYDMLLFFHAILDPVIYQFHKRCKDKKLNEAQTHLLNSAHQEMRTLQRARRKKSLTTSSLDTPTQTLERNRSNPSLSLDAEQRLSTLITQNLVLTALEDNSKLTLIFRSFGSKKIELVKIIEIDFLIHILDSRLEETKDPSRALLQVKLSEHKDKIGSLYIQIIAHCLAVKDYNPGQNTEESLRWFRLFIAVMKHSPYMPMIFSDSDASLKFLSSLSPNNLNEFAEQLRKNQLGAAFSHAIIHRLVYKREIRLAKFILNVKNASIAELVKETTQEHFYFSLLGLKNKAIDFLLLTDPQFIIFIKTQTTLVARYLYAELLERLKLAFDYSNLPRDGEDGTDVRHTQSGEALLKRGVATLRKTLSNKFLSTSEINQSFWGQEIPVNKLGRGEEWLKLYRANLSLLLSEFLPHLPHLLAELNGIYEDYYNQTIGRLTSMDYSRYNPIDHSLWKFPDKMARYLAGKKDKVDKFNANLHVMDELYKSICALSDGTVRFNSNEQSGFRPITLVADNILNMLAAINPCATSFKRHNLAAVISLFITDFCRAKLMTEGGLEGICTPKTLIDVSGLEPEKLWLHTELSVTLLQMFQIQIDKMKKLNQNTLPNDCFTEDVVIDVINSLMNQIALMKTSNEPEQLPSLSAESTAFVNL